MLIEIEKSHESRIESFDARATSVLLDLDLINQRVAAPATLNGLARIPQSLFPDHLTGPHLRSFVSLGANTGWQFQYGTVMRLRVILVPAT